MIGRLSFVSMTGSEPIGLEEAKLHCKVDQDHDESLLAALIPAVREFGEQYTQRAFREQRWTLTREAFPAGREPIEIPKPPLIAVESIQYRDSGGGLQTWPTDQYLVTAPQGPTAGAATIVPAPHVAYPSTQTRPDAVVVEFRCGYAKASDVPAAIRAALLLMLGHLYEHRQAVAIGSGATPVPLGVETLLAPYAVVALA